MAQIVVDIDIAADGSVTVTPNPVEVANGDTVKWHLSSNAHPGGTLRVLLPKDQSSPFSNSKRDAEESLEPGDSKFSLAPSLEAIKWPASSSSYSYRTTYVGNPMTSEVTALLTKGGPAPIDMFWEPSFKILYDAYYQELSSEALGARWEWIDKTTSILVGLTSGSAVTGWAIWGTQTGKLVWAVIGGAASLASFAHSRLAVPAKVREQAELRHRFRHLRLAIQSYRQNLEIGLITQTAAKTEFDRFQTEFRASMEKTKKEIAFTTGLRKKVEEQLRAILKQEGLLDDASQH